MKEQLHYLSERSIDHLRWKPFASVVTVLSLTLCLVLAGAGAMLHRSVKRSMPPWMAGKEALAFLHADVPAQGQARIAEEISRWPEIAGVRLASRAVPWMGMIEGTESNPFAVSLQIGLKRGYARVEGGRDVVERVRQLPEIEEVYYGGVWPEKVRLLAVLVKSAESGAAVLVAAVMTAILFSAVRATLLARQEEIEIYQIVGATPFFIRAPFYMEGMLHGAASGLAASALLCVAAASLRTLPLPLPLSWPASDWVLLVAGLLAAGVASGCIGAWMALRVYYRAK